jgi:hypothetical protein
MNGSSLKVARLDYKGASDLASSFAQLGASAVYVCEGLDSDLESIKKVVRQRKVFTMSSRDGPVRAGLSVGVYVKDGKSSMIVNLPSSQAEGVALSPELLRLAEIVR